MTQFDEILDTCLQQLADGNATLNDCLQRFPTHAARLRPLLKAALSLQAGQNIHPTAAFKARARANLTVHMQANPRKQKQAGYVFRKLAASLAALLVALFLSGTAYAQGALPGDAFYEWKLASERAWRAVSPDPVGTDIALANRRIDEMNAVSGDSERKEQALKGYFEVIGRLQTEIDSDVLEQILPVIAPVMTATPAPEAEETQHPQPGVEVTPMPGIPEAVPTEIEQLIPTIVVPLTLP